MNLRDHLLSQGYFEEEVQAIMEELGYYSDISRAEFIEEELADVPY